MASYQYDTTVEFPQEAIEYLVIWRSFQDACIPKCQNLNSYTWAFEGELPQILIHPQWGPVWDTVNDVTLAHPNCRCTLEVYVRVDWSKIPEFVRLQTIMSEMYNIKVEFGTEVYDVSQISKAKDDVAGLRAETARATVQFREFEYIAYRLTSMIQKMGLPPEVSSAITQIQEYILLVRLLHSSLILLETGTPYGLIIGGISMASTFLTYGNLSLELQS